MVQESDADERNYVSWGLTNSELLAMTGSLWLWGDPAAQAAADCLSGLALQKGSNDNIISVIVVDLKPKQGLKQNLDFHMGSEYV